MESYALALSSSTLNLKSLNHVTRSYNPIFAPLYRCFCSSSSTSNTNYKDANFSSNLSLGSYSNLNSSSFLFPRRARNDLEVVRAVAAFAPENSDESTNPAKISRTLQLAMMFGVWYLLNINFNIFNKQVLKVFPYPTTVTTFQFGCGTLMILIMWKLRLHPKPKFYKSQIAPVLMLAVAHTMGNLLTNISLGRVAVSFTHTIKAMEPFFTVLFSALLLSERPTLWVVSSLIPIVGGVALASFTEASFNWVGFGSAMASNLTNQSRNVLSKKFMVRKEEALDNINLFSVITIISFIFLVPVAFFVEGFKLTPEYLKFAASQGVNVKELCVRSVLAGICFHSYQQVSYIILGMVSPVTHAVGNCVKRVVVIGSSVIFFQTPVSPVNSLGTGLALAGVFLYSRVKRIKPTNPFLSQKTLASVAAFSSGHRLYAGGSDNSAASFSSLSSLSSPRYGLRSISHSVLPFSSRYPLFGFRRFHFQGHRPPYNQ